MLNNLLKTLKSEKSSKSAFYSKQANIPNKQSTQQCPIAEYKISNSLMEDKSKQVHGQIKKIRYYVLPEFPNIFTQVLACPISVFHFLPHGQRKVKQIDLTFDKFPHYLQFLRPFLQKQLPTFNHLLINDYPPGIGIMPHSDGPSYRAKVFVLSLNAYAMINFQKCYTSGQQKVHYKSRILLQPNSIHIFEEQAYNEYLHGIENYSIDSILLRYDNQNKRVTEVNIDNYGLLACRARIEQQLDKIQGQGQIGPDIRVVRIKGNQQYTHKIQITRRQRISITIRQKYHK